MGCGASLLLPADGAPPRRGSWAGNRRPPSRIRAPASPDGMAGTAQASSGGGAGDISVTTPSAAARRRQQAYEELEAGMAATPMGSLADEFKFFCPLCMCVAKG